MFEFEIKEQKMTKKNVAAAIIVLVAKYRQANGIKSHEQLSVEEVDEIVDGVNEMILEYEELKPMKKS